VTGISERRRAAVHQALPDLLLGDVLGGGAGGCVVAADAESTGARLAVKILADEALRAPFAADRLRTEAGVLIACRHRNLIEGISFHEFGDMLLLVMERVDAISVLQQHQEGGLALFDACGIVLAAARALHAVHQYGFLHGDVKPENVLFDPGGRHRLVDFGLARRWPFARGRHAAGTPRYMAPEAIVSGGVVGPATDVYALGMMLYELLSDQAPFLSADDPLEVMRMHVTALPISLGAVAPHLPRELVDLVMRAIEKNAADRISSASELAGRLAAIIDRFESPAPTPDAQEQAGPTPGRAERAT
jgi:serine/threonine protein kinase